MQEAEELSKYSVKCRGLYISSSPGCMRILTCRSKEVISHSISYVLGQLPLHDVRQRMMNMTPRNEGRKKEFRCIITTCKLWAMPAQGFTKRKAMTAIKNDDSLDVFALQRAGFGGADEGFREGFQSGQYLMLLEFLDFIDSELIPYVPILYVGICILNAIHLLSYLWPIIFLYLLSSSNFILASAKTFSFTFQKWVDGWLQKKPPLLEYGGRLLSTSLLIND